MLPEAQAHMSDTTIHAIGKQAGYTTTLPCKRTSKCMRSPLLNLTSDVIDGTAAE